MTIDENTPETPAPPGYTKLDKRGLYPPDHGKAGQLSSEATFVSLTKTRLVGTIVGLSNGPDIDVAQLDIGVSVSAKSWAYIRSHIGDTFDAEVRHTLTETEIVLGRESRSYRV